MHEYNEFDVAGQALAKAEWEFSSILHAAEIDTINDYRWAHDALREKLLNLRDNSLLMGQIVEVDVAEHGRVIDYSTNKTEQLGESRIIGTFEGFYVDKTVTRDQATISAALPYIDEDDLSKMDRMPLFAQDMVDIQLGIRLKTIIPIPGTDESRTFVEIPMSDIEDICFPEQDHPLIEEETLMFEYASIIMQANDVYELGTSLDSAFEAIAAKRYKESSLIGRKMLLLVEEGSKTFDANLDGTKMPIDVPVLKRLAGKLIGFAAHVKDPQIGAEPLALISDLDTGEVLNIHLSSIAEGALIDELDTERDLRLFNYTSNSFNDHVRHIIDKDPWDHQAIYEYLQSVCWKMNNGADPILGLEIVLQTYRDSPYEISTIDYSDPSLILGEFDFEELMDVSLGESFSLEGRLVGYRFAILEYQDDKPIDEFDIRLIAIIKHDSTLLHLLKGVSVLVPVDAIKNARLGKVNYN